MPSTVQQTDEEQIRELVTAAATAYRERDAQGLIARYSEGCVRFDVAPPLQHTGADVHDVDALQGWFAGFEGPVDLEIRDLTIAVGDDVAFCHSLNRLSASPRGAVPGPDGEMHEGIRFSFWLRATVCLRKLDGAWQITHEHESTPFYMDGSFKAAVDLEP